MARPHALHDEAGGYLRAAALGGEPLGERVQLVHAEQGLGDTLQFCRYVSLLPQGSRVVLEVQPPLRRLLSRLPGSQQVIVRDATLPPFELHCPLLSLPRPRMPTFAMMDTRRSQR